MLKGWEASKSVSTSRGFALFTMKSMVLYKLQYKIAPYKSANSFNYAEKWLDLRVLMAAGADD